MRKFTPVAKCKSIPFAAFALAAAFLLSVTPAVKAQEPEQEAPKPAQKWDLELPLRLDGLMFCDVKVGDDGRVWNFMIDSGATSSVLSTRTANMLGIDSQEMPAGAARGVGTQDVRLATGVTYHTAGHAYKAGMSIVTDLTKIADMTGTYMDGILGADWLMQWGVCHFDFVASTGQFRKPAEGKGKRSIQDMLAGLMEGMGGGLPGLPGMPGRNPPPRGEEKREPEKAPEPEKRPDRDLPKGKGEDFSRALAGSHIGVMAPMTTARHLGSLAGQVAGEIESMECDFAMSEINLPLLGGVGVLVNLWFVDMVVEGKPLKMIFDTGAAPLLVLNRAEADTMDLGHSFTVPVTGLGEADATMGIVNEFRFGGHRERRESPAVIMDLSETFAQFDDVKQMLAMFGPLLRVELPKPAGLVGLPFALRYRSMTVDYERMKLVFTKHTAEDLKEPQKLAMPTKDDGVVVEAVKKTWAGTGGTFGITGKSLKFSTWKDHGLDGGIVVETVTESGPAATAGIEAGDILALMGTKALGDKARSLMDDDAPKGEAMPEWIPVRSMSSLAALSAWLGAGTDVEVRVWRAAEEGGKGEDGKLRGALRTVTVKLGAITEGVVVPERYREKSGK